MMAMGLPPHLLLYAENLYRRFPEEFIALGMPGLEEIYDLRPNGMRFRRVSETPMEKTVEIVLRRWQIPMLAAPQVPAAPVQPYAACATSFLAAAAAAQAPAPLQPASASAPLQPASASAPPQVQEDQAATQRLMRLESALMALKPQIEALLVAKAQEEQVAEPQPAERHLSGRAFNSEPPTKQAAPAATSELRNRRNVQLQIKAGEERKTPAHAPPAVVRLPDGDSEDQASASEPKVQATSNSGKTQAVERQRPKVNAMRVLPSAGDPASPRSPGRYSAWK